jgi:hypothetical protein
MSFFLIILLVRYFIVLLFLCFHYIIPAEAIYEIKNINMCPFNYGNIMQIV